jgi:hypothetical protein
MRKRRAVRSASSFLKVCAEEDFVCDDVDFSLNLKFWLFTIDPRR